MSAEYIEYAYSLPSRYGTGPSSNDYLALALAKQEGCPLLTGDQALKSVANQENVPAMGTIWLLRAMVEEGLLTVDEALAALRRMRESKRRLPWAEAERILSSLG